MKYLQTIWRDIFLIKILVNIKLEILYWSVEDRVLETNFKVFILKISNQDREKELAKILKTINMNSVQKIQLYEIGIYDLLRLEIFLKSKICSKIE